MLSGLAFATLHIPNGWPQAASAAAFGVITALIAMRTVGIAFTFGLHLVNNLFGAVIVVSANDVFRGSPALFTQATPHLMWLDAAVPFIAMVAALWLSGALGLRSPSLRPS
jgi:membrane protease YdiL (CAAX protease family)